MRYAIYRVMVDDGRNEVLKRISKWYDDPGIACRRVEQLLAVWPDKQYTVVVFDDSGTDVSCG